MNSAAVGESGTSSPRRVLLVDDDTKQLKLMRARLQSEGFDVETARGADEALLLLARDVPDVIMSDVLMGEVDGFGFCRRVRELPALSDVPVILLSAHYDEASDLELARRVGASELVQRTPDFDAELDALLRNLGSARSGSLAPIDRATYEKHLRSNGIQLAKLLTQTKRAEERYRKLLEHAHDAIMITRDDGTVVEANHRWCEILGVPVDELVGRRLAELIDVQPNGMASDGPIPFVTRDGRIVQMLLSQTVVDLEGESFVLSIGNDVTNVLESSRAVARVEERYRTLVERIPDVIWTKREGDPTTFFTPNAEKVFGEPLATLTRAELASRLARVHPDDAASVKAAFEAYFDRSVVFDIEYRYRRRDGRWVWLRERSFPISRADGVNVGEGMISDITERKRLEDDLRQSQKMEALGQLTGGIAHDFNNILATILANAQFIIDALPEGNLQREDATVIRDSGERAASLTRQLLAFSRRQVLEPRTIDLNAAVAGVQRMLRSIIRENIAFNFLPGSELGAVRIDLGQLEQVIMNLVVNACDAMPAGGALTIETANDRANDRVLLRVRDTGVGMDEGTQRRIFEPFFTTKEKGRGTGLGLSTCYGIVEQSGGRISVESQVGFGTAFTIALPRVDEQPGSSPRAETGAGVERGNESILVVEDDPAVRNVVKRILERWGYTVMTAQNATEAIAIGVESKVPIDLVVSDIILPGAMGPHLVERMRRERPGLKALFVSGYSDVSALGSPDVVASLRIIEKPFKPEKLLRAIRAELVR